jgi:hypothetical protein
MKQEQPGWVLLYTRKVADHAIIMSLSASENHPDTAPTAQQLEQPSLVLLPPLPLTNYTLSSVCPNCAAPTYRRACKVRCDRCGFMWDCSEL